MLRHRLTIALAAAMMFCVTGAAQASPIVDLVVISNDGSQTTVRVDLTMPENGLYIYSFSARFSGGLSFNSGESLPPPPLWENGNFNNGIGGPDIVSNIHGLPPTHPPPVVGAGAQKFTVAMLTFDLNGVGGLVETGLFVHGVDGFYGPDGLLENGEFDSAQIAAIHFGSLQLIPEPSTGMLFAVGLGLLAAGLREA